MNASARYRAGEDGGRGLSKLPTAYLVTRLNPESVHECAEKTVPPHGAAWKVTGHWPGVYSCTSDLGSVVERLERRAVGQTAAR